MSNSVAPQTVAPRAPHGILQAGTLEGVANSFSWVSFQPRDQTRVSCFAGRQILYCWSHQTGWMTAKEPILLRLPVLSCVHLFIVCILSKWNHTGCTPFCVGFFTGHHKAVTRLNHLLVRIRRDEDHSTIWKHLHFIFILAKHFCGI